MQICWQNRKSVKTHGKSKNQKYFRQTTRSNYDLYNDRPRIVRHSKKLLETKSVQFFQHDPYTEY